jgi:16S rRNA (guanine527-N7)-methyltransferase
VTAPDPASAAFISALQSLPEQNKNKLINQIEDYEKLLIEWNQKINLISENDLQKIWPRHFCDALQIFSLFPQYFSPASQYKIADVGSGSGLPGIPLALALSESQVTLIEATQKKTQFHEEVRSRLSIKGLSSLSDRVEALGQDPKFRESYDMAVSRALSKPASVLELVLPLVKLGGRAFFWGSAADWQSDSYHAICNLFGGRVEKVQEYDLPGDPGPQRVIACIFKESPTPKGYPRRIGVPQKSPLK